MKRKTTASLFAAPRLARTRDGRWYVYVVELRRPGPVPSVYVGSSAHEPEERFRRHKRGGVATSRYVRRYGVRLMPEFYARLNPLTTREDAHVAERAVRRALRERGYRVFGSCDAREDGCFF